MIHWLHISDMHMKNMDNADQDNFCGTLIRECIEERIQVDFVVATGDFHDFKDTGQYNVSKAFLRKLMKALRLNIEKDLFIIPGNHDVDGERQKTTVEKFLSLAQKDAVERMRWMPDGMADQNCDYVYTLTKHPEVLQELMKNFNGYRAMAGELIQVYQEGADSLSDPASVHVRIWEDKLNILHLNTSILSDGGRGHADAVDINLACSEKIKSQLDNGLPTIVIGHHSFHDLHLTVKERLVQLFNQTNVWAYLAGDKHRTNYRGDEFLIYRKTGIDAWPNIVAGKIAASVEDSYSEFGAILYCWDNTSTVALTYLQWSPEDSGKGLIRLKGDAKLHFPMPSSMDSQINCHLLNRLIEMRDRHPSFQLMKIDEELFPKVYLDSDVCMVLGERGHTSEKAQPLSEVFQESWSAKAQNHLMLEGEGGIGKTVALLSLATQKGFLPHHVPAVYVTLHALKMEDTDDGIGKYIQEEILYGNKKQYDDFNTMVNQEWREGPQVVLLLDGFNEIPLESRYVVARNIEDWSHKLGIQIIIASRFDVRGFLPSLSGEFHAIRLQPLTRVQIQKHLRKLNLLPPTPDSLLWSVIDYPLMLSLYAQAKSIQEYPSSVYLDWQEAKNAGTILWNYLQRELWRCQRQTKNRYALIKCVLATEWIAPYIAWMMVQREQFFVSEEEFYEQICKALDYLRILDRNIWPAHIQKVIRQSGGIQNLPDADEFFDLLTCELNLFRIGKSASESMIGLMHQRFRDCMAAIHLLNLAYATKEENGLPEEWKKPIDFYVMNFIAELINLKEADRLWEANRKSNPTDVTATRMMLELHQRLKDYDFSKLDFSGMDLRKVNLYSYRKPGSIDLFLPKNTECMKNVRISKETFEVKGLKGRVSALAVTLDGKRCVTVSSGGILCIWDLALGDCVHMLEGLKYHSRIVAVTPNGKQCIGIAADEAIHIWDMDSGECLHVLKDHKLDNHRGEITDAAIAPDGKRCVSAYMDGTLGIWDMQSGECLHVLSGHKKGVCSVKIAPDAKHCVSGSDDGTLRIWDMDSGECLYILRGHEYFINIDGVAITSDGKRCISASGDKTLRIWDMQSGKCLHILKGHGANVRTVSIGPDGHTCVSASWDDTLRIWDIDSGECLLILEDDEAGMVETVLITPDGNYCFSISYSICSGKLLQIWDMVSGRLLHKATKVDTIEVMPDGRRCVSASSDGSLHIWDIRLGRCLKIFESCESINLLEGAVAVTPDGCHCAVVSSDKALCIWNMEAGKCEYITGRNSLFFESVRMMPNGKSISCRYSDGTMGILDIASGECLRILPVNKTYGRPAAVSPDGRRWVGLPSQETLCICDMDSDECLHILKGHERAVWHVLFSPDGKRCISAGEDCTLRIWDVESGECLHVLAGHVGCVCTVSITPDGRRCVSGSFDNTLRIWDIESGECLHILTGHTDHVGTAIITSDGKFCISMAFSSTDKGPRIWDVKSGKCLYVLQHGNNLVCSVAIAPDGLRCVSGYFDGTLSIWDMKTGKCLHIAKYGEAAFFEVIIMSNGKHFIGVSNDGLIRTFDMESGKCLKIYRQIFGVNLSGIDLSTADITPSEYAEVLRQNGVIVPQY